MPFETLSLGLGILGQGLGIFQGFGGGGGKTRTGPTRADRANVEVSYAAALDPWIKAMGARVPRDMRALRTAGPMFGADPPGAKHVGYDGANVEVFGDRAVAVGLSPGAVSWPSLYPVDYGRARSWAPGGGSGAEQVATQPTDSEIRSVLSDAERSASGILDRLSGDVTRSINSALSGVRLPTVTAQADVSGRTLLLAAALIAAALAVAAILTWGRRR